MKEELKKECERLCDGFSKPTDDEKGKQSFGIGFWKGVQTYKNLIN